MNPKMFFIKPIILVFMLCLSFSCKKEKIHSGGFLNGSGQIEIIQFNKPDTVMNFGSAEIRVKSYAMDPCFYDLTFDYEQLNDFEYSIKAFGTFNNDPGICPQGIATKDTIIHFQPTETGTYIFNIYSSQDQIITDSIVVN